MSLLRLAALLIGAVCACGDDAGGGDGASTGAPDAAREADSAPAPVNAAPDAAPFECPLVAGCPDWLEEYEREVVGSLSGERPIDGDASLSARFTEEERALVRARLSTELASIGLEPELHEYATGANVFAELPGTGESQSLVVLGAHFDSVAQVPGAADDGTGVALVLAAARYLGELERREQTVVFVLFDEEERGLLGSQAFAEKLRLEGATVDGMHNFDMLSWDLDGDRGVELWSPDPTLEPLYRDAAAELGLPIAAFDLLSSDHGAFIAQGFPALGLGEEYRQGDTTPHYHQASDTYDKIDFGYLASSTILALRAIERQLGADQERVPVTASGD